MTWLPSCVGLRGLAVAFDAAPIAAWRSNGITLHAA